MHYEKYKVILYQKSKIENRLYIVYARIRNSSDKAWVYKTGCLRNHQIMKACRSVHQ